MSGLLKRVLARTAGYPLRPQASYRKDAADLYPDLVNQIPIFLNARDGSIPGNLGLYNKNILTWRDNTWVRRAVDILGSSIASLPLSVVEIDGRDVKPLPNHPLSQLFRAPNPAMSASFFWGWWMADLMLGGEEGIELVRNKANTKFIEMWPRQPSMFTVKPGATGRRYLSIDHYTIDDQEDKPYPLDVADFIHFKFYNPLQPYRGISPMTAIRLGVKIDFLSQAWALNFFKNQGRPDFAVMAPEGMVATEKRELLRDINAQASGDNTHSAIVLESGVQEIKFFDARTPDKDWLEQREFSRDEVGGIFGVPDEIMGYGKNTYENFSAAHRVLWTITLVPLIGFRDDTLTHHFTKTVPVLKANQAIRTDLTQVPELREDLTALITQGKELFTMGYGLNDINQRLGLGMPDVPWGATGWIGFNMVPIDASLAGGDRSEIVLHGRPRVTKFHEFGSVAHETFWRNKQRRLNQPVEEMQRQLKRWLQGQQNRIGMALRQAEQRDIGRGANKGKDLSKWLEKGPEDLPSLTQIYNYTEEVAKFEEEFFDLFVDVFSRIALVEFEDLPTDIVGSILELDNPETKAAIEFILRKQAQETQNTTWSELISLFVEAEEAGDGIPQIQERLSVFYGGKKSVFETERIARTAMTAIDNSASQEAWKQSGVVGTSSWISALLSGRTRDAHAQAHGQEQPLGTPFIVDGEELFFPGDPDGSPGNIINCLCSLSPNVIDLE